MAASPGNYDFVTGDTGSVLQVTCKDKNSGALIDLTGATVKLYWKEAAGTLATRSMTVTSAAGGVVQYQFATGELFGPRMEFEVEITDVSSKIITVLDTIKANVRVQIG